MGIVRLITPRGTTVCEKILSLMKNVNLALEDACPSVYPKSKLTSFVTLLGFAVMLAGQSQAANILVNPGFEAQVSAHVVPQGWTRFAPPTAQAGGNYWVGPPEGIPHTGASEYKEWGASYNGTNNVAGIYQDFSSAPGSVYQASGWCLTKGTDLLYPDCYTWFEVAFLGASTNLLALYKSAPFNAAYESV